MSELSPQLAAALRGDRPLLVGIVEINLPGHDLLLLDGAAQLMIGERKFVGRDPVYGVLSTVKGLTNSIGDQVPSITLGLIPAGDAALAALVDPAVQGSLVTISIACVDIATGIVVPGQYILAVGELDVPTIKWGANTRTLEYRVASVGERLFQTEEGRRLSDAFHQKVWPGELGLGFVTDVETVVPWGQKQDNSAIETRTNLPGHGGQTWNRT